MSVVALTEAQWQGRVLDLAHLRGWRSYHPHDSRSSAARDITASVFPYLELAGHDGPHHTRTGRTWPQ